MATDSSTAYVKNIPSLNDKVLKTDDSENNLVYQTSPAWVLSFIRWDERDTLRTNPDNNTFSGAVRNPPLVVQSDCIQLEVVSNKGTFTASMSATLLVTDINYVTALAPGDFVFVNILSWESDAVRVSQQALNLQPINGLDDGFKGIFKIQLVQKTLSVIDPQTGTKALVVKITGFAFTEFNNVIYFNDQLFSEEEKQSNLLFLKNLKSDWTQIVKALKGSKDSNLQDLMKFLIDSFIGTGVASKNSLNLPNKNFNTHFFMPPSVGALLGIDNVTAAKDIYSYIFGIQSYSAGDDFFIPISNGMNPIGLQRQEANFWFTDQKCKGYFVPASGMWNGEKAWSILNQYVNSPLNELYTCFRISPNGRVMPTIIFRQAPFTNEDFDNLLASEKFPSTSLRFPITKFYHLPRWAIDSSIVFNFELGRDEAARINFVQYTGNSSIGAGRTAMDAIAKGNYLYDIEDVQRSGLRPAMFTTPYDIFPNSGGSLSPGWAKIIGDFLIGGHLKFSGTIVCIGLQDPIAVGDNLQFDGVVYHIEQVVHKAVFSTNDGKKTFRTIVSVSNGLSVFGEQRGTTEIPILQSPGISVSTFSTEGSTTYDEMNNPGAYAERRAGYNLAQPDGNAILPGVSESKDDLVRGGNVDESDNVNKVNVDHKPFDQPNIGASVKSTVRRKR